MSILPMVRGTLFAAATAATAVLVALPAALVAEPHPLVGVWKIDFPGGMRIENGNVTVMRLTGTLTVTAESDSLIATLVSDPQDETPRRTIRLAAKSVSGDVTFVNRS